MHSINRSALVVRPKSPFFDWAKSLEGGLPENTTPWTSVYLVSLDEDDEPETVIRQNFKKVFEEQLESWCLVVADWPAPRTFALFQKWFDTEVVDLVFDLAKEPIEIDD